MSGNLEEHVPALEKIGFGNLGCREHVRHQPLKDMDDNGRHTAAA
jgi:hypothetical protein